MAGQNSAETYIRNNAATTDLAGLAGALNDAFSGRGKNSGQHDVTDYGSVQVLHASAGTKANSTTVFFFRTGTGTTTKVHLIALGEHDGNAYKIDKQLGQNQMPFQKNKKVSVTGNG